MPAPAPTEEAKIEKVEARYSNIEFQLISVVGTQSNTFGLKCPPREFVKQLNNLMLVLPTLYSRLIPPAGEAAETNIINISAGGGPSYTCQPSDRCLLVDASLGPITIYLLKAFNAGLRLQIIKTDSSGNAVTVTALSGDTIEGSPSRSLGSQYQKIGLLAGGNTVWLDVTQETV